MSVAFPLSYSPYLRGLFRVLWSGPAHSDVVLTDDAVEVRMGLTFRARLDRRAISEVARYEGLVTSWGAHGWRHRWLVNGLIAALHERQGRR